MPHICRLIRTTLNVSNQLNGAAAALLYLCQRTALGNGRSVADQLALALLDRGCEVDKRDESTGCTALIAQAAIHNAAVTYSAWGLLLLLELGADINAQDLTGNTAMHYLAMRSKAEALRGIAEAGWMGGADLTLCNKEGKTAVQVAQLQATVLKQSAAAEVLALLQLQHKMRPERAEIMLNSLCDNTPLVPELARIVIAFIEGE
jgi:ankyrin repeat protein